MSSPAILCGYELFGGLDPEGREDMLGGPDPERWEDMLLSLKQD